MKPDEFEKKLSRQPLREIPGAWRAEILAAAYTAQAARQEPPVPRRSWLSTFNLQLSTFLWPHPKAWATLAAVWVLILGLQLFTRDDSGPRVTVQAAPPSPEVMVELRQQQRLFAELIGPRETRDADRPRIFTPKPRGERADILVG